MGPRADVFGEWKADFPWKMPERALVTRSDVPQILAFYLRYLA